MCFEYMRRLVKQRCETCRAVLVTGQAVPRTAQAVPVAGQTVQQIDQVQKLEDPTNLRPNVWRA